MKILMLGWEFPPRITGGLGTACQGICEGLAGVGVDVTFVTPSADPARVDDPAGSRRPAPSRADTSLTIPSPHPPRGVAAGARTLPDSGEAAPVSHAPRTFESASARSLRWLRIPSPLRPYQSAGTVDAPGAPTAPAPSTTATAPHEPKSPDLYGDALLDEVERFSGQVLDRIAGRAFDVVHAHDWMTLPAGLRARERSGRPLVWHVHSTELDRSPRAPHAGVQAIEQLGVDEADRIIAVSGYTAGVLSRAYGADSAKIQVVHNAVHVRRRRTEPRRPGAGRAPLVLFLGRLAPQKGPELFLRAAAIVRRACPEARFVLAGSGDLYPRLVALAKELGIAPAVHFTGFLAGADVERMFSLADVYVMPSVSEPFGIAALEAMSAEVPVVVPRSSGVAEILTNALKVDPWNTDEVADRIVALLKYPALRRSLVAGGKEEVKRMRWEVRARALLSIYEELAA